MGTIWEDQDYDISRIVKRMFSPSTGSGERYVPGKENPETTQKPSAAVDLNAPGGAQARLEWLESVYPSRPGRQDALSTYPSSAIPALSSTPQERPRYGIPSEMQSYFDEAIKTVTGKSPEIELLKNRAQGYGLGMVFGKDAAKLQSEASRSLADIENTRRNAIAHLSNTMAALMMEPSRFTRDIYGKELEYDLTGRKEALRGALEERKLGIEEAREARLGREAPATALGLGERGEKKLFGWDPETKSWTVISKGALPVEVGEGNRLIDPLSGKVLGEGGKKSRLRETLATTAFKSYADQMKAIEEKYSLIGIEDEKKIEAKKKAKAEAENAAWERLAAQMEKLGYGDMFPTGGGAINVPTIKGQFGEYIFKDGKWQIKK